MNKLLKTALMISGGFICMEDLCSYAEQNEFDFIIGVDGGCKAAYEAGIKLDLMYGDFDTLDKEVKDKLILLKTPIHELSPIKNVTDTHGAFLELIARGVGTVCVFGCTGTRMDHTTANLMVPFRFTDKLDITYFDKNNRIRFYEGECIVKPTDKRIHKRERDGYTYLSIIPVEKTMIRYTKGLKYRVKNQVFETYDSFGVSNEIMDEYEIASEYGKFMIIEAKD